MLQRPYAIAGLLIVSLLAPSAVFSRQPAATLRNQTTTQLTTQQLPGPQTPATSDPNDPIVRIKDEGLNRSQVMKTLSYLSDVIGPRLTWSPGIKRANNWTREP